MSLSHSCNQAYRGFHFYFLLQATVEGLLVSTTLEDMSHKRRYVVTIQHNASAEEALHQLAEHHITSAPVVLAPSLEDQESDTYMGIIDIAAILKGLFQGFFCFSFVVMWW